MKQLTLLVLSLGVTITSFASNASDQSDSQALASAQAKMDVELALAPVKTANDLINYMAAHRGRSAIDQLPPLNKELFLRSLTFDSYGLSSFNYAALSGLKPAQVYQVLGIFGMQSMTTDTLRRNGVRTNATGITPLLEPLKGYRCAGGHTCMTDDTAACTSNC